MLSKVSLSKEAAEASVNGAEALSGSEHGSAGSRGVAGETIEGVDTEPQVQITEAQNSTQKRQ